MRKKNNTILPTTPCHINHNGIDHDEVKRLLSGQHRYSFHFLGLQSKDKNYFIRAFFPSAKQVFVCQRDNKKLLFELTHHIHEGYAGFFSKQLTLDELLQLKNPNYLQENQALGKLNKLDKNETALCFNHKNDAPYFNSHPPHLYQYQFCIINSNAVQYSQDTYSFKSVLLKKTLKQLSEGNTKALCHVMGAQPFVYHSISGALFIVWAPNAWRVSVVGDFNNWNGCCHLMRWHRLGGIWEIFIPGVAPGAKYKYEIMTHSKVILPLKADPYAKEFERAPATASIVSHPYLYQWHDQNWMAARLKKMPVKNRALSIYEVHVFSWMTALNNKKNEAIHYSLANTNLNSTIHHSSTVSWNDLSTHLIPYVKELGFTHIELMPIAEHPFKGSWGYQPLGQFAPTSQLGTLEQFAAFVDQCHLAGLGVIIDWVPGHFPNDDHGLYRFDGTSLYEYADPREGFHPSWNCYIYNLGRTEVASFLIASIYYWFHTFHIDGVRVDAVASLLQRDFCRKAGEWRFNIYGGRENLESIAFLKKLNIEIANSFPGTIKIAEETSAWPRVTAKIIDGGLGFDLKWNMGWMYDSLQFMRRDAKLRCPFLNEVSFSIDYAHSEHFILTLSHDEVAYTKGSLLDHMSGNHEQKFANLRAYLVYMWTHPGKKMIFMGGEFGQLKGWNHDHVLSWQLLVHSKHRGIRFLIKDLNQLYCTEPSFYFDDSGEQGFQWIAKDCNHRVIAYLRYYQNKRFLIIINFSDTTLNQYRLNILSKDNWQLILHSNAKLYSGSNRLNNIQSKINSDVKCKRNNFTITQLLPLCALIFEETSITSNNHI